MTTFYPDKFKKKVLPKGFFKQNLLTKDFSLKKKAMQGLILANVGQEQLQETVLKVVNIYQNKVDDLLDEGLPKAKARLFAKNSEKLLQQRIESLVVYSEVLKIKEESKGKYYKWLPSGASDPDPEHQLLYGKTFLVGEGDDNGNMPGERFGCQCGMEILD
jgi:hypothetical protein